MPYVSFSCLIAKAWTASAMLNRRSESRNPFISLSLNRKQLSSSLLSMMLAVGFLYVAFISLRIFLFVENIYYEWVLNFVKCFFGICWSDHMDFLLYFVKRRNEIDWFSNVKPTSHSWDKPYFLMMYYPFTYYWIQFAVILLGVFASLSMRDTDL